MPWKPIHIFFALIQLALPISKAKSQSVRSADGLIEAAVTADDTVTVTTTSNGNLIRIIPLIIGQTVTLHFEPGGFVIEYPNLLMRQKFDSRSFRFSRRETGPFLPSCREAGFD